MVYDSGNMFLKRTKVRSGKNIYTDLQLVESVWKDGRPTHKVVANLGREDQLDPVKSIFVCKRPGSHALVDWSSR